MNATIKIHHPNVPASEDYVLTEAVITRDAVRVNSLTGDDYIELSWLDSRGITLPEGCYIVVDNIDERKKETQTYTLYEPHHPERRNSREWVYKPKFESPASLLKKRILFHRTTDPQDPDGHVISIESEWTITSTLDDILGIIVDEINRTFGIKKGDSNAWKFRHDLDLVGSRTVAFKNNDIASAVNVLAQAFDTEAFIDSQRREVFIGYAMYDAVGAPKFDPEINIGIPSVDSAPTLYNRFYVYGSTQNITKDVNTWQNKSIGQKRLGLNSKDYPNGYIDVRRDEENDPIYEQVITIEEIYPKNELVVVGVDYFYQYLQEEKNGNREKVEIGKDSNNNPIYQTYCSYYVKLASLESEKSAHQCSGRGDRVVVDGKNFQNAVECSETNNISVHRVFNLTYEENKIYSKDHTDGLIVGDKLKLRFTTGALGGRDFYVVAHPTDTNPPGVDATLNPLFGSTFVAKAGYFAIDYEKVEGDYIIPSLPENGLIPRIGDKCHILNYRIKEGTSIFETAQARLAEEAKRVISRDYTAVPKYTFDSNPVAFYENYRKSMGDTSVRNWCGLLPADEVKVVVHGVERTTRVVSVERKLDCPWEMKITTSSKEERGRVETLEREVAKLLGRADGSTIGGGGGGGGLTTEEVEALINVVGDRSYLSKIKRDSAEESIQFKKGLTIGGDGDYGIATTGDTKLRDVDAQNIHSSGELTIGGFTGGLVGGSGAKITNGGDAEMQSLTLHKFLEVPELRYNRVSVEVGNSWRAPGGGVIAEVIPDADGSASGTIKLKLEDGEIGSFEKDDICMGIFHNVKGGNATKNTDDGKGNFTFAGFSTIYFCVTEVLDPQDDEAQGTRFRYLLRSGYTNHPVAAMSIVAYGNFDNKKEWRQQSRYSTRTYERYLCRMNTWEHNSNNVAAQFGDLSNLEVQTKNGLKRMHGYSAYLNNLYMSGTFDQFEAMPLRMEITIDGDNFIAPGETKNITCKVFKAWEEIPSEKIASWSVIRESAIHEDDTTWNTERARNFNGTLAIDLDDLGDARASTIFTFTATLKEDEGTATASLEI